MDSMLFDESDSAFGLTAGKLQEQCFFDGTGHVNGDYRLIYLTERLIAVGLKNAQGRARGVAPMLSCSCIYWVYLNCLNLLFNMFVGIFDRLNYTECFFILKTNVIACCHFLLEQLCWQGMHQVHQHVSPHYLYFNFLWKNTMKICSSLLKCAFRFRA